MRIEFSRNELRAAKRLAYVVACEIDDEVARKILAQDLYEEMEDAPFVSIKEDGGIVIDVPEKLVVEYYDLYEEYIPQAANIAKSIYNLLKQFKMVTKNFERQMQKAFKRYIPKKEEAPQATEE